MLLLNLRRGTVPGGSDVYQGHKFAIPVSWFEWSRGLHYGLKNQHLQLPDSSFTQVFF